MSPIKNSNEKQFISEKNDGFRILAIFSFMVSLSTLILSWQTIIDNWFPRGEIIYKTVQIEPDPELMPFPFCFIPNEIIPVTQSMDKAQLDHSPKRIKGWPQLTQIMLDNTFGNIIFTITNNTNRNFVVDRITAVLNKYERFPSRTLITDGEHAATQPVQLYLALSPGKKEYDILKGRVFEIEKGKTEHQFNVYVACQQPGIYRFKIVVHGRLEGKRPRIVISDMTYSFALEESGLKKLTIWWDSDSREAVDKILGFVNQPEEQFNKLRPQDIYKSIFKKSQVPKAIYDDMLNEIDWNSGWRKCNLEERRT